MSGRTKGRTKKQTKALTELSNSPKT